MSKAAKGIHIPRSPALLAAVLICLHIGTSTAEETPGEHFEKFIKEKTAFCKKHRLRNNETTCDILKLTHFDPFRTAEGRFAHSIAIPNPISANSGYRQGMSSGEYFRHLCEKEAGNFIYRTILNVNGITILRPRVKARDDELEHLHALEDPYGYTYGEAAMPHALFVKKNRYEFLDLVTPSNVNGGDQKAFTRYTLNLLESKSNYRRENVIGTPSRYGYTWRGIQRPHDREMGIAGGELIVLDLESGEVIGVRRGYIQSGRVKSASGIWWLTGRVCPAYGLRGGRDKDFDFVYWFVGEVLQPKSYLDSFRELGRGR